MLDNCYVHPALIFYCRRDNAVKITLKLMNVTKILLYNLTLSHLTNTYIQTTEKPSKIVKIFPDIEVAISLRPIEA